MAVNLTALLLVCAQLVELADTLGLEPSAARHGGSTPSLGTILKENKRSSLDGLFSFLGPQSTNFNH